MKNKCKTCGLSELSHPLKNLINVNTGKKWSCKKFTPEDKFWDAVKKQQDKQTDKTTDKIQTDKLYNTKYTSKACGKCKNCGIKSGWDICPNCGEKFIPEDETFLKDWIEYINPKQNPDCKEKIIINENMSIDCGAEFMNKFWICLECQKVRPYGE